MGSYWKDYLGVIQAVADTGRPFVIIGGHACNIWTEILLGGEPKSLAPFTSKDLDIVVDSLDTIRESAASLRVRPTIADIGLADQILGGFRLPGSSAREPVQFLRGAFGVNSAKQIITSSLRIDVEGWAFPLFVMYPPLLLKSKLGCLRALPQVDRQDEKHVKLAVCFTACFLHGRIEIGHDGGVDYIRTTLNDFEDLIDAAFSSDGLHAWRQYGICPENAIPIESVQLHSVDIRLMRFLEEQWPRVQKRLADRRQQYAARCEAKIEPRFPTVPNWRSHIKLGR